MLCLKYSKHESNLRRQTCVMRKPHTLNMSLLLKLYVQHRSKIRYFKTEINQQRSRKNVKFYWSKLEEFAL